MTAADAPTTPKGVSSAVTGTVPLGGMFQSSDGLQMRAREVTIEPGGWIPVHTHKSRPEMVYLLEGEVTDHVVSEGRKARGTAGMTMTVQEGVTHWIENTGGVTVRAIVVDIIPVK
ncbi:MAG: cupin domain-containing protein [Rhodospirillales bacterium]|nr:cupin domain-containing protein [Rhodospirillales bacterium]MBO6786786.1 cupin domain-containing protein [Rhodospirillales bacterium]